MTRMGLRGSAPEVVGALLAPLATKRPWAPRVVTPSTRTELALPLQQVVQPRQTHALALHELKV